MVLKKHVLQPGTPEQPGTPGLFLDVTVFLGLIIHSLMPLWQKINAPVLKPELDQTTSDCPPVAGCPKYH